MKLADLHGQFNEQYHEIESAILTFCGVDGYDVYNCSIPFLWKWKRYIFGRVERRNEWMRSWVRLFEESGQDEWTVVPQSMIYQLEDPFVCQLGKEIILGGTHVRVQGEELDTFYDYFYHGTDLNDLYYFTTGPEYMKDIRLVELADGKIGVFSRPRKGNESQIGFVIVDSLADLTSEAIENAPSLKGIFKEGEWGGCNQAYLLSSGKIGVIGHQSYICIQDSREISVYLNTAFVLTPESGEVTDFHIIGSRTSYPNGPAKKPSLVDCAFTSGIVGRQDGKVDLYSGIGDCQEGRTVIDYPFKGHGTIVTSELL